MLHDCGFFLIVEERMTVSQWQEARRNAERIRDSYERGLEIQKYSKKHEVQEASPEEASLEEASPEEASLEEASPEEASLKEPVESPPEVFLTIDKVATRKNRQCIVGACIYSR